MIKRNQRTLKMSVFTGVMESLMTLLVLQMIQQIASSDDLGKILSKLVCVLLIGTGLIIGLKMMSLKMKKASIYKEKMTCYNKWTYRLSDGFESIDENQMKVHLDKDFEKGLINHLEILSKLWINLITVLCLMFYLAWQDLQASLIVLGIGGMTLGVPMIFKDRFKMTYEAYMIAYEKTFDYLSQVVEAFETVKLLRLERSVAQSYRTLNDELKQASYKIDQTAALEKSANHAIDLGAKGLLVMALTFLMGKGKLSLVLWLIFVYGGIDFLNRMPQLYLLYYQWLDCKISLKRLETAIEIWSEEREVCKSGYCDGDKLLPEAIYPQMRLLLKGPNGIGKTTMIRQWFYARHKTFTVTYHMQESQFINMTISELLEDELNHQSKAHLKGFEINFDEVKNKTFQQLSSGQKQKLMLVRAFCSSGGCLILDEPSNHLDGQSIQYLRKCIKETNRAVVCVSHDERLEDLFLEKRVLGKGGPHES